MAPKISEGYRNALDILCNQTVTTCLGKDASKDLCQEAVSNFSSALPKTTAYTPGPRCARTLFSRATDACDTGVEQLNLAKTSVENFLVAAQELSTWLVVAVAPSATYCCADVRQSFRRSADTCDVTITRLYEISPSAASPECQITLAVSSPLTVNELARSCFLPIDEATCVTVPLRPFDFASGYAEGVDDRCPAKTVCHNTQLRISERNDGEEVTW